jgi:DNA polymerase-3 subunit epsilon
MNHLIFDTETTGFYNPKLAPDSKLQARVIQLAAVKLDNELNEIEHMNVLIKPEEWYSMSEDAFNAHGISLEQCRLNGLPQIEVITKFHAMRQGCEYLAAHNIEFDFNMIDVEYWNLPNKSEGFNAPKQIGNCTMTLMTPICRLPHKRRNSFGQQFKWPKLKEAIARINPSYTFKEHDGLADARACAEVYRWLIRNNILKLPVLPIE